MKSKISFKYINLFRRYGIFKSESDIKHPVHRSKNCHLFLNAEFFVCIAFQMWDMLFSGRYIMLLMGIFSMYCGFVYNDFFAKPLKLYPVAWRVIYEYAHTYLKYLL